MKNSTNKNILRIIILLIAIILLVKLVPPVNDVARAHLPAPVLKLIGEQPKGVLEIGADKVKDFIGKIK